MPAQIVALFVSTKNRVPLTAKREVHAALNRGIEGDRHSLPGNRRAVLFMPREVLDELRAGLQAALDGRRGRFARVVTPGALAVGNPLTIESP